MHFGLAVVASARLAYQAGIRGSPLQPVPVSRMPQRLHLNSFWVKTLPGQLLWGGGGGTACAIYFLEGIIEVFVHHASRWGQ